MTASLNEPGGNHQNEGALCGLPLIYRDSGCLPEYCENYGIPFNENNLEEVILKFMKNYKILQDKILHYPILQKNFKGIYKTIRRINFKKKQLVKNRKFLDHLALF